MRILGLDLSSRAVGWALVEEGPKLQRWGVLRPKGRDFDERFLAAVDGVVELVESLGVDVVAVERPVYVRNAAVALKLGGLFFCVIYTLSRRGVAVRSYEPSQVKLAATGTGKASKEQVQRLVGAVFGAHLPEDAADAAATALCCLHRINSVTERD